MKIIIVNPGKDEISQGEKSGRESNVKDGREGKELQIKGGGVGREVRGTQGEGHTWGKGKRAFPGKGVRGGKYYQEIQEARVGATLWKVHMLVR